MAKQDQDFARLLAGAVLAGGAVYLAASAYQSIEQRRAHFFEVLNDALQAYGLQLINASLGRTPSNEAVWIVTYQNTRAETRLQRITVPTGSEPYAEQTAQKIAAQLA